MYKKIFFILSLCTLFGSCVLFTPPYVGTDSGTVAHNGNYSVTLLECNGNRSTQEINIVVMITNKGVNESLYVGGVSDGTMAIDNYGNTLYPSAAASKYEFPTGVSVRVAVRPFKLVEPRTSMLRSFRLGLVGASTKAVEFRNVPIRWVN